MSLSSAALRDHTLQNQPDRRTAVQRFLSTLPAQPNYDPLPPSPPRRPDSSPVAAPLHLRRHAVREDTAGTSAETALVLHASSSDPASSRASRRAAKRDRPTAEEVDGPSHAGQQKKKKSLVASMRPRLSTTPAARPADRGSSPVLVPRNGTALESSKKENTSPHRKIPRCEPDRGSRDRVKADALAHQRQSDFDSDEDAQHLARLDARRGRRRAKALIVKDKTQSAAATGAAAAAKLKRKAKEKRKRADELDPSDAASDDEVPPRKKKSAHERARAAVQSTSKSANVGNSRLTIRPNKLGLFNKGATSGRISLPKPGRKLPDLAFVELDFLNAPRRSPSPSSPSSAGPSEDAMPPPPPPPPASRLPKTYRTRSKSAGPAAPLSPSTYFLASSPAKLPARKNDDDVSSKGEQKENSTTTKTTERNKTKGDQKFAVVIPSHPTTSSSAHSAYSRARRRAVASVSTDTNVLDTTGIWKIPLSLMPPASKVAVERESEEVVSQPGGEQGSKASLSAIGELLRPCRDEEVRTSPSTNEPDTASRISRCDPTSNDAPPLPFQAFPSFEDSDGPLSADGGFIDIDLEHGEMRGGHGFVHPRPGDSFDDPCHPVDDAGSVDEGANFIDVDEDAMPRRPAQVRGLESAVLTESQRVWEPTAPQHGHRAPQGFVEPASFTAEMRHVDVDEDEDDEASWSRDPSSLGLDELELEFGSKWVARRGAADGDRGFRGLPDELEGARRRGMDPEYAKAMKRHWYRVQV